MTKTDYNDLRRDGSNRLLQARGGVIYTTGDFSDSADLPSVGFKAIALTAGTLAVQGLDGNTVNFLAADLVALGNEIPFPIMRILTTGTTVTRVLVCAS